MVTDPRFATNIERVKNRDELEEALEAAIAKHDREPLLKVLEEAGVPATPVNTVAQVMEDPQTAARADDPARGASAARRDPGRGHAGQVLAHEGRVCAPRRRMQGEHTDEVLAEYGYSSSDIAALRAKKVVV